MDPITLLQITHVEQRLARETAAMHNRAVRARRGRPARRGRSLSVRFFARPATKAPACVAC